MGKWYVVQVISSKEQKVKQTLEENKKSSDLSELIEEIVVPTENVMEVKQGQQSIREKRIWPGYILVKMQLTDDSWMFVKGTNGVIDFLGQGKPLPLTEEEVNVILKELESKKGGVVQKHQFEVGDHIKINEGVFLNFVGTIVEVFHDKGRLSATVSIFGRETRVDDLEFWQVEEINDEPEV